MLPRPSRLRSSAEFTATTRGGRRSASGVLVVHLRDQEGSAADPPRIGLTIGKAVGNAVTRHRTARRLRHLCRSRLAAVPAGVTLVIRALPGAGEASSAALARDLDAALARLARTAA